jgi:ABC-type methionine transport system permease subunit
MQFIFSTTLIPWTIVLFIGLVIGLVIDWLQTRVILQEDRWTELNPIISKYFKRMPWLYFLVWIVAFANVAFYLKNTMIGTVILAIAFGSQAHCVWRNWALGIRIRR